MTLAAIAQDILDQCLAGAVPDALPQPLLDDPDGRALFGILAEGLADRFEPALCDAYAHLFAPAIGGPHLIDRYRRVRRPRPATFDPRRVFVLSRVTLGADVAVTSVVLDAAKRRYPAAEIVFAGPRKNFELFAGDPRLRHAEITYRRGSLHDRLSIAADLRALLADADSLVLDPDSRLTQLGLLPVCGEERYHLFESRSYGGATDRTLPDLTAAWCFETLGIADARPYLALATPAPRHGGIAVSLGVGENPAKRVPDPFEEDLLRLLASQPGPLWIDKGAGGDEAARVERAAERSGAVAQFWDGSFAGFASIIAGSRLYIGYDSAGQHIAAAAGVPLVTVFAGFPTGRMFHRWRPSGPQCHVIRVDSAGAPDVLDQVRYTLAASHEPPLPDFSRYPW